MVHFHFQEMSDFSPSEHEVGRQVFEGPEEVVELTRSSLQVTQFVLKHSIEPLTGGFILRFVVLSKLFQVFTGDVISNTKVEIGHVSLSD